MDSIRMLNQVPHYADYSRYGEVDDLLGHWRTTCRRCETFSGTHVEGGLISLQYGVKTHRTWFRF